jgi:hypothetical protein
MKQTRCHGAWLLGTPSPQATVDHCRCSCGESAAPTCSSRTISLLTAMRRAWKVRVAGWMPRLGPPPRRLPPLLLPLSCVCPTTCTSCCVVLMGAASRAVTILQPASSSGSSSGCALEPGRVCAAHAAQAVHACPWHKICSLSNGSTALSMRASACPSHPSAVSLPGLLPWHAPLLLLHNACRCKTCDVAAVQHDCLLRHVSPAAACQNTCAVQQKPRTSLPAQGACPFAKSYPPPNLRATARQLFSSP